MNLKDLETSGRATISVEEAAQLLRIGRTLAYQSARNGQLPVLHLGARLLVSVPGLLAMLGGQGL
jgi:excisionase family DNA binding protein